VCEVTGADVLSLAGVRLHRAELHKAAASFLAAAV
jgi:hypothetical protein